MALGNAYLPLQRLRQVIVTVALLTAAFNALTTLGHDDFELIVLRGLAGLGEGVLVWATTSIIVRSKVPGRITGIFMVVQTLSQATLVSALAWWVLPFTSWQGGFWVLAGLSLAAAALAKLQPAALPALVPVASHRGSWSISKCLLLGVVALQLAAIGAFWVYLEPIGQIAGLDVQDAQSLISLALLSQVAGGCVATLLVTRLNALVVLVTASLVFVAVMKTVYGLVSGDHAFFVILVAIFGFIYLLLPPFQMALAFRVDTTGRVASMVPVMQLLGSAIGPLVASHALGGADVRPVVLMSAGLGAAATIGLLLLWFPRNTTAHVTS
ncbi:Major Facilitator Superfamily protein [compost metagenome]